MQALSCEKQLKGTGIITNIIHIMKEEGLTRPVRVRYYFYYECCGSYFGADPCL
jgi:hypothetical protein